MKLWAWLCLSLPGCSLESDNWEVSVKDLLGKEHAAILATIDKEQEPGTHAKEGEAHQEQTRRIKEAEALVDAERKKETAKSGFVNKEKVCQKL